MDKTVTVIDIADAKNYGRRDWPTTGIIFFSDEWNDRRRQCRALARSQAGLVERKLHGRHCKVKEVGTQVAREFLEENHIQGSNVLGIVYFGLYHNDELVAVMSLGRHSRQIAENRIVLDRFCVKNNVTVRGGASKLFKQAVDWARDRRYDEIVSFSDNRWSDGGIYRILGFSLEKEYRPDYSYVDINDPTRRLSKQSQKKSSVKCPEGMTEFDWAKTRGLRMLWDRGKKRWVYGVNPDYKSWKERLSERCAKQHESGVFNHSHIRGYFVSKKNGEDVYYGSSYELRCCYLLENDPAVKSYRRADSFKDTNGGWRNPDLHIVYADGTEEIREVKPLRRVNQPDMAEQIAQTRAYCRRTGLKFKVWTEQDSGFDTERAVVNWAKRYIAETTGNTEWIERQKANDRKKAKKHYQQNIAKDTVEVECKFCNCTHTPLRLTHDRNVARNGRYICEREGGYIAGSKPKKKKVNPHAAEGKKECTKCHEVKDFEEFGLDKSRPDGYASRCKECRK